MLSFVVPIGKRCNKVCRTGVESSDQMPSWIAAISLKTGRPA